MVISHKLVTAVKKHCCESCMEEIHRGSTYWRVFGYAYRHDRVSTVKFHYGCYNPDTKLTIHNNDPIVEGTV